MNVATPAPTGPVTRPRAPLASTRPGGERQADRAVHAATAITAAFLLAGVVPMWRFTLLHRDPLPALLHAIALAAAVASLGLGTRLPRVVRDWLPLALGPFLYIELRWLIEGAGRPHADARVIGWERALFNGDPSATWAPRHPSLPLSELLHLCYASYYLLVLLPPLVLYATGRRRDFARTLLALATVYAACFTTYLLFPVDGPRFLVGPAAAPDGPVRGFVLHLLAAGSSRGTAFPSSHVAAAVVASLAALRADRRMGIPIALLTVGLAAGTVYGGFHYAVDALAGLLTAMISWTVTGVLWRTLAPPGEQSATAA